MAGRFFLVRIISRRRGTETTGWEYQYPSSFSSSRELDFRMTIIYETYNSFISIREHSADALINLDVAYFPTLPGDIALGEIYEENCRSSRTPLNWVAA